MTQTIAVYEIDGMAYGGPEEGGWWYETGHLVRVLGDVEDEEAAYAMCRRYNSALDVIQARARPVSSVAYTGGRLFVDAIDGEPEQYYPEQRPQYE